MQTPTGACWGIQMGMTYEACGLGRPGKHVLRLKGAAADQHQPTVALGGGGPNVATFSLRGSQEFMFQIVSTNLKFF